jgi:hypothetical protein
MSRYSYPAMTCCEKFEDAVAKFGLFMMNLIDFFIGSMFLTFGIFFRVKLGDEADNTHVAWLSILSLSIGISLLFIVACSFTSLNLTDCKIGVKLSGYAAFMVSISSFITAIVAIVVKGDLFDYLYDNCDSIGLSNGDIDTIKSWYTFIILGLFVSFLLQFIRFKWSNFLYRNFAKTESKFQRLLDLEEEEYEVRLSSNKAEREEKYDSLRSHYKNKYGNFSDTDF